MLATDGSMEAKAVVNQKCCQARFVHGAKSFNSGVI
jgi:hypothetical protein